ncbi:alpha-methylacyl-CoA racemase [Mycobacterium lentiflavum]|uniref:Alpha-methylacyl-CoA racemase n=1 Tax=Mycobacterium lentiflavum TaxID=141349 RepID=A0A0E4CPC2_MYCLN|nr:alpha-methylacyl-CoA racemase [Mycobacterium lentiflavum]
MRVVPLPPLSVAKPGVPPLTGVRVLDLSALGPGPFCSMLLADFGADVVAVERPATPHPFDPAKSLSRGKRSVVVDLRAPGGAEVIARLADAADVLLESNRPGTMERRGLGPDVLCERNPRLIYTRLTGWGQDGPYRDRAGHDINYAAIAGTLGVIGDERPVPPLAMLGDLAGGSLFAALGIVMAIYERTVTGRGQVIDASIADGSALLNLTNLAEFNAGIWAGRGRHVLSGSAPFYGPYPCADGRFFAVGAIEPKFYAKFLGALGIDDVDLSAQLDPARWPPLRERIAAVFATKPRAHWTAVFADVDGCGAPVLELEELADDPHLRARSTITTAPDGSVTAGPAPRLSRTPGRPGPAPRATGADTRDVLRESGFSDEEVSSLIADGTVAAAG